MTASRVAILVLLLSVLCFIRDIGAVDRPNIVLILADDMGYGDCGVYNPESKIKTPHIDQLAKEGLRFTDAHSAASTCTPSRYGLLTGINPARTGVLNTLLKRGRPIIAKDETTIASLLKDQGYITKMVGKWHLGFEMDISGKRPTFDFSKPLKAGPVDRGFDSFFGIHSSAGAQPLCYFKDRQVTERPTAILSYEKKGSKGKSLTITASAAPNFSFEKTSPMLCQKAVGIIREHAESKESKPLFLYYASPIPHNPWVPTEAFRGKSKLGAYGDFMMQLDDVVGQLNEVLKETGLANNTLLIFTSDNGPGPGAVEAMNSVDHAAAGGLRGQKSDSWEGGHRVPFIAKWPGRIAENSRSDTTINFTDLFATFAEMLEVDYTQTYPHSAKDSWSFYPVLLDPSKNPKRPAMINGRHAIREGDWKLISTRKQEDAAKLKQYHFKLHNLANDLTEQNDLAKSEPEQIRQLFNQFKSFTKQRKLK